MPDSSVADAAEIAELAAKLFADASPPAAIRQQMATRDGYDRAVWQRWAAETGLPGLAVPAEYGGTGLPVAVLGPVFEAAGAHLVCAPLFSTVGLAIPLLLAAADSDAASRWLPQLCDGSITATAAVPGETGGTEDAGSAGTAVRAVREGPEWRLTGTIDQVVDGASADLLLVVARTPDGAGLFAVDAITKPAGLERQPLMSLDLTRRQAAISLDGVYAEPIGPLGGNWIEPALDVARVLLAGELVGVAQRCLDLTVEYTSQRVQFGRPIGSFQAVKQRAAEMLLKVELARSAARHAAESLGEDPVAAPLAKAYCAEAATWVAAETIQLHGGIGFTWEHDAHLYYKRAITDDELLGAAAQHWHRVTDHLDRTL